MGRAIHLPHDFEITEDGFSMFFEGLLKFGENDMPFSWPPKSV